MFKARRFERLNVKPLVKDILMIPTVILFFLIVGDINFFIDNFDVSIKEAFIISLVLLIVSLIMSIVGIVRVNNFRYFEKFQIKKEDIQTDYSGVFFERAIFYNENLSDYLYKELLFNKGWIDVAVRKSFADIFNLIKKEGNDNDLLKIHTILSNYECDRIERFFCGIDSIFERNEFVLSDLDKYIDKYLHK